MRVDSEALVARALAARERAHAPYSQYRVGAALLTRAGEVFTGVNIENASYGLTICAERVAVFRAIEAGERDFAALAVATRDGGTPCGACRQVLREFARDLPIFVADEAGKTRELNLAQLLPESFGGESVTGPTGG